MTPQELGRLLLRTGVRVLLVLIIFAAFVLFAPTLWPNK